jgi:hypothetical protein
MIPLVEGIQPMVHSAISLWTHPLLISFILLQGHLLRGHEFEEQLSLEVSQLESSLGVTKSARLAMKGKTSTDYLRRLIDNKEDRIGLTTRLNTTMTDMTNRLRVLKWDRRYYQFLHHVHREIQEVQPRTFSIEEGKVKAILRFLESDIESAAEFGESMASRLQTQLNVV